MNVGSVLLALRRQSRCAIRESFTPVLHLFDLRQRFIPRREAIQNGSVKHDLRRYLPRCAGCHAVMEEFSDSAEARLDSGHPLYYPC